MAEGSWEPRSKKPRIGIYVLQCLQHEPLTVRLPENINDEERRMEAARIAFPRPRSQHETDEAFDAFKQKFEGPFRERRPYLAKIFGRKHTHEKFREYLETGELPDKST